MIDHDLSTSAATTVGVEPRLCVRGLVKQFRGRRVVNGVDLDVLPGEVVGLLGKNGAGKTTSFRMIVGLLRPDAGEILFDVPGKGKISIARLPMYRRARAGMGYLPQESSVFRALTVEENILAVLEARGVRRAERRKRTARLVDELGLQKVVRSRADTLSGGERRRLEIARALSLDPTLMLLDEPFSGVDPIAVAEIQEIVRSLTKQGIGVLLTDHNVYDTLKITNRTYIIDEGRIMTHGSPKAIVDDPLARRHYLGERFRIQLDEPRRDEDGATATPEAGDKA